MTTIAYRDGVLAFDSLIQSGGTNIGAFAKGLKTPSGALVAICGHAADAKAIMDWAQDDMRAEPPRMRSDTNTCALIVHPDGTAGFMERGMPFFRVEAPFLATGSGEEVALGAMAAGVSAEEAIRIACQYDAHTGGEIVTLQLVKQDPEKGGYTKGGFYYPTPGERAMMDAHDKALAEARSRPWFKRFWARLFG